MKTAKQLMTSAVVLLVVAAVAHAGPPLTGSYHSPPVDNDLLNGHHSESWAAAAGFLTIGNAIHAASWDGATLGTQWWFSCPSIVAPPLLLLDTTGGTGTGQKQWLLTLTGGTFWLSGAGNWANGDASYTGPITTMTCVVIEQFVSGTRTGADVNVSAQGYFIGPKYPCFTWGANAAEEGNTDDDGPKPADFPDFLQAFTCVATPTLGQWFDHLDLNLNIYDCTVPTEDHTWGSIKEMYKD